VLAPAYYFGGVYLFSISFSLALVFTCAMVYRATGVGTVVISLVGLLVGFPLAMVFITFLVHAFFNVVTCIVLSIARVRVRFFATGLCLTMFVVYAFAVYSGLAEMRELTALKASYPFESIYDRLAFERQNPPTPSIQLASMVDSRLDEQDSRLDPHYRYSSRTWALEQLHEHATAQFSRAAGFGLMRMPSIRTEIVRLEPRSPIRMPAPVAAFAPFETLHQSAVRNFVDPERMGYVRNRTEVSGFESHRLSSLKSDRGESAANANWQVTRLELVSLLRQSEPRVYVSASMPEMDKLADVPTRSLNSFEEKALPQLVAQKDVVTDQQPNHIQMLGSLRAGKTCLECHSGERGKLLGAFTYELVPIPDGKTINQERGQSVSL